MDTNQLLELAVKVGVFYVPFLFSLCVHEFAHGWVAKMRGDPTAEQYGRLTLNPHAHADIIGTYVLPIVSVLLGSSIFFGWAKPVPVNARNFKNPRTDMFWVASAGPLSNVLMALVGSFAYVMASKYTTGLGAARMGDGLFGTFIFLNLFLAFFNLIPVHPLDGAKILARFIPYSWDRKLEDYQQYFSIILMILFISGLMRFLVYPVVIAANVFIDVAAKVLL